MHDAFADDQIAFFFCGVRTYVHWCETGEKYWDTYFAPMLYCMA